MSFVTLQNGDTIAQDLRSSSQNAHTPPSAPTTLASLLDILSDKPPNGYAMLKTTCSRLSSFLGKPVDKILLNSVEAERGGFRQFLVSRKYSRNSVRTYTHHAQILLSVAKKYGWKPGVSVAEKWREVYEFSKQQKCSKIVLHLARTRLSPREVTIADVEQWTRLRVQQGISYVHQRAVARQFWRILQQCKATDLSPDVLFRQERYGIPLRDFSPDMKAEVEALLNWKQAIFAVDRPKGARVRAVTAKALERTITALVGFAINVLRIEQLNSLEQLVTKRIVGGFVDWCLNVRRVKGKTVMHWLAHLYAAMNQHPSYAEQDRQWFRMLLDDIEIETDTEKRKRKAELFLEYDILESIPDQIRTTMLQSAKKSPQAAAMLAMTELIIRWLLVLPWRQRNLRECRILGPKPNLFKRKIDPFSEVEKPDWVRRQEHDNPDAEFWIVRFSADETKTKNEPEMFLPRALIGPLEEFIDKFRSGLAGDKAAETLFVNTRGKSLNALAVTHLVSQATLRYGGRRVTPHLFRDVFAYTWLKSHAKDYLTVSKALWHSNLQTTIKIYGGRFNESSAVCAVEQWLEERSSRSAKRQPAA